VYHVVTSFVVVDVSELRNAVTPGLDEGGFGGRHREIVVLSFRVVYAVVAMVTKFRILEALLKILKEIAGEIAKSGLRKDREIFR
jgi:hypothetical protein